MQTDIGQISLQSHSIRNTVLYFPNILAIVGIECDFVPLFAIMNVLNYIFVNNNDISCYRKDNN